MADINLYFPKQQKWEGGFVNDIADAGGATNKGVTLSTWRSMGYDKDGDGDIDAQDIKLLSEADAKMVLKIAYWDRWRADAIKNQSIAEILVEWVWGSGYWGISIPQRVLGVDVDGRVGMQTINAINNANQEKLYEDIKAAKFTFIDTICKNSVIAYEKKIKRKATQKELLTYTNERFRQGWINRINDFKFNK